jgi:hypothetical protein
MIGTRSLPRSSEPRTLCRIMVTMAAPAASSAKIMNASEA